MKLKRQSQMTLPSLIEQNPNNFTLIKITVQSKPQTFYPHHFVFAYFAYQGDYT